MPGRTFSAESYRYGYNGKEKDDEIKGEGNSYDFGARIYDPRIGRWLAIDPQAFRYSELSPYNFCDNNPIIYIDPNGEGVKPHRTEKYSNEAESKILLNNSPKHLTDYPTTIHQLGVTSINFDQNPKVKGVWYSYNDKTQEFDVEYNLYVLVNEQLGEKGLLNKYNPGLSEEVWAHEQSHGDQWEDAFKSKITVKVGSETFVGTIDQVLTKAAKKYDAFVKANPNTPVAPRKEFLDQVFVKGLNEVIDKFNTQAKADPHDKNFIQKPNVEYDANSRALVKLKGTKSEKMPYTFGGKPAVKPGGEALKSDPPQK
ncbi:MAG: hypothetical protein A3F72_01790 [Bacteroidetes bacterium RIFCSPLOWO2_12_FULL_35_15]|nr:MAG: hypothetical protein A3F72_01790 [Bacteroidetes bacterium RIFCSPLOWO2_12_FULL_35_15]